MNKTSTEPHPTSLAGTALEAHEAGARSGAKPGPGTILGALLRRLSTRLKNKARATLFATSLTTGMAALAAGAGAGCQVHPDLADLYRVPPAPTVHPVYDPEAHFDLEQTSQGEESGEKHGETGQQNDKKGPKTSP